MKNKEIVFVSNFWGNGGATRVISVLAEEFVGNGYEVTVCSYPIKNKKEYRHALNVKYVEFDMRFERGFLYKIERILKLRKEIKKHKGAVIVSFEYFMNMQTIVAMTGLDNRLIISERNDPARVGSKKPIKQLRDILYRFTDCLVCQTQEAMEYFPKAIQEKSVVIVNPIKSNLPEPWVGERKKQIVNFCRLEKQKNIPLLIDAFEEFRKTHSDYILAIYGDGKERINLENYIQSKGLKMAVTLYPAVQDIHDRIRDSMMFVSSSDYEGLSNSMIEAMAIGLPTICTDCPCGGARMIIDDGENGFLVPVRDKEKMAYAMGIIADNKAVRDKFCSAGYKIREKLDVERIAREWEIVIKGEIKRKG